MIETGTANERQVLMREQLPDGIATYELFCENIPSENGKSARLAYGIGIESSLQYDTGSISLSDITENIAYARELFERVIAYTVTPHELMYVAEDYIFEKYGR